MRAHAAPACVSRERCSLADVLAERGSGFSRLAHPRPPACRLPFRFALGTPRHRPSPLPWARTAFARPRAAPLSGCTGHTPASFSAPTEPRRRPFPAGPLQPRALPERSTGASLRPAGPAARPREGRKAAPGRTPTLSGWLRLARSPRGCSVTARHTLPVPARGPASPCVPRGAGPLGRWGVGACRAGGRTLSNGAALSYLAFESVRLPRGGRVRSRQAPGWGARGDPGGALRAASPHRGPRCLCARFCSLLSTRVFSSPWNSRTVKQCLPGACRTSSSHTNHGTSGRVMHTADLVRLQLKNNEAGVT